MITKEYKQQMEDKQQAREFFALNQMYGTDGAFKDFFNKSPFTLNDTEGNTTSKKRFNGGNKFTKPKNKRKK